MRGGKRPCRAASGGEGEREDTPHAAGHAAVRRSRTVTAEPTAAAPVQGKEGASPAALRRPQALAVPANASHPLVLFFFCTCMAICRCFSARHFGGVPWGCRRGCGRHDGTPAADGPPSKPGVAGWGCSREGCSGVRSAHPCVGVRACGCFVFVSGRAPQAGYAGSPAQHVLRAAGGQRGALLPESEPLTCCHVQSEHRWPLPEAWKAGPCICATGGGHHPAAACLYSHHYCCRLQTVCQQHAQR